MSGNQKNITPYQQELLTILMEECGETVQEICKIFRFGINERSHHFTDGRSHLDCLTNELGDIIAMIDLLVESGVGVKRTDLAAAVIAKREKVTKWMKYKKDGKQMNKLSYEEWVAEWRELKLRMPPTADIIPDAEWAVHGLDMYAEVERALQHEYNEYSINFNEKEDNNG